MFRLAQNVRCRLFAFINSRSKKRSSRRYIVKRKGILWFFNQLDAQKINYVVLRWFENLPNVEEDEDIDILVDDCDLARTAKLLRGHVQNGLPCDLYSVSGSNGTSYRSISYFPVELARKVLSTAIFHRNIRVPNPEFHFLSMIYHVLYHKGYKSGVKSIYREPMASPEHDYCVHLRELSKKAGCEMDEFSLESLHEFMKERGYAPSLDILNKLAPGNAWIVDHFFRDIAELSKYKGVTLFVVRELGMIYIDRIGKLIEENGFFILRRRRLDERARARATHRLRGGNWSEGIFAVSAGGPVAAILAYDAYPLKPDEETLARHPGLDNLRIYMTKEKVRIDINGRRAKNRQTNVLHSADNTAQAIEYARVVFPETLDEELDRVEGFNKEFETGFVVLQDMTAKGRRAKTELIEFNGTQAICKTFKPGAERYLQREIEARKVFADVKEVAEVLYVRGNKIVVRAYKNEMGSLARVRPPFFRKGVLPVYVIRMIRRLILEFRRRGYELIDLRPDNILYDPRHGFKLIDFEFMQRSDNPSGTIKGAYAWYKIPESFKGDRPIDGIVFGDPYRRYWRDSTCLPLMLCAGIYPSFVLHGARCVYGVYLSAYHGSTYLIRAAANGHRRMKRIVRDMLEEGSRG